MKVVSKSGKSVKGKGNGQKSRSTRSNCKREESSSEDEEKEDLSILRQPVEISVRGVSDLIHSVSNGTQEFKELVLQECNIIYECRICQNLFRSLANFISHKRVYCTKTYNHYIHNFSNHQAEKSTILLHPTNVTVEPDSSELISSKDDWTTSDKTSTIEDADSLQVISKPVTKIMTRRNKEKSNLSTIIDKLVERGGKETVPTCNTMSAVEYYTDIAERVAMRHNNLREQTVKLEHNEKSSSCVYQTVLPNSKAVTESIKTELNELENLPMSAVLKENGNFVVKNELSRLKHPCTYCHLKFLTRKTLTKHVKIHHRERTCYPCPLCRVYLASPWGVYRHLGRAHHRTEEQIRRLRPQVLSKAIKRRFLHAPSKLKDSLSDIHRLERENEKWNNFEGDLRCHLCGKLFNRRAALNVHNNMCKVKTSSVATITTSTASTSTMTTTLSRNTKVESKEKIEEKPVPASPLPPIHVRSPKIIPPVYQIRPEESGKVGIQIRRDYNKEGINRFSMDSSLRLKPCDVCKHSLCSCKDRTVHQVVRKIHLNYVPKIKLNSTTHLQENSRLLESSKISILEDRRKVANNTLECRKSTVIEESNTCRNLLSQGSGDNILRKELSNQIEDQKLNSENKSDDTKTTDCDVTSERNNINDTEVKTSSEVDKTIVDVKTNATSEKMEDDVSSNVKELVSVEVTDEQVTDEDCKTDSSDVKCNTGIMNNTGNLEIDKLSIKNENMVTESKPSVEETSGSGSDKVETDNYEKILEECHKQVISSTDNVVTNCEDDVKELQLVPNYDPLAFSETVNSLCGQLTCYMLQRKFPSENLEEPFFGFSDEDDDDFEKMATFCLAAEEEMSALQNKLAGRCGNQADYSAPLSPVFSDLPSEEETVPDLYVSEIEISSQDIKSIMEKDEISIILENGFHPSLSGDANNVELTDSDFAEETDSVLIEKHGDHSYIKQIDESKTNHVRKSKRLLSSSERRKCLMNRISPILNNMEKSTLCRFDKGNVSKHKNNANIKFFVNNLQISSQKRSTQVKAVVVNNRKISKQRLNTSRVKLVKKAVNQLNTNRRNIPRSLLANVDVKI